MKIILSPSKTQADLFQSYSHSDTTLLDEKATLSLFKKLKKMSPEALGEAMSITGKLLDKTVSLYQSFDPEVSLTCTAIELYTGTVFDQLDLKHYEKSQRTYIEDHIMILSAMYGLTHPFSALWPYRLDFTMKFPHLKLKTLWSKKIVKALSSESVIIDLASQEYSVLLNPLKSSVHRIVFLDSINGKERIISTNAKKARGKMVHFMITNRIQSISELALFSEDGYLFQPERSSVQCSVFLKSTSRNADLE